MEYKEIYYCDEYEHFGQIHIKDAIEELNRINNKTASKDEFKIIFCNTFIELKSDNFTNEEEIETKKNHCWIVKK